MVGLSWVTNLLYSDKYKTGLYKSELDNSREGLNRLIELTKQLDEIDSNVYNEDLLNLITNSLGVAIWAKDLNGRFIYLNDACAKIILRTTVDKALRLTDEDFECDTFAPVCLASDKKVMLVLETKRFIEGVYYKDGTILWLDVLKSPLIRLDKLIGVTGIAKDITEAVSKSIGNNFKKAVSIEIPLSLEYSVEGGNRRKHDILNILNSGGI